MPRGCSTPGAACSTLRLLLLLATLALPAGSQRDKQRDCGRSSCYDVLGVGQRAGDDEIKKAYRGLAKEWHPDKNPVERKEEAERKFQEIGNAYEILSTERREYDNVLRYGASPFGGFQSNGRQQQNFHQHHWQGQQRGQDPNGALGGLLGLLVPLAILVYVLSSNAGGGGDGGGNTGGARGYGETKKAKKDADAEPKKERTPSNRLPKGTRVQVHGLQSAGGALLNGTRGGVVSYDADKGRYILQLAAKAMHDHTSLLPKNIQQIVYGVTILRGFRSRPAVGEDGEETEGGTNSTENLAGQRCRVVGSCGVGSDADGSNGGEEGEWLHLCELSDDKECTSLELLTRLPAEAVRIPAGVRIVATGLKSRPELNGERAEIVKWNFATERYHVQFEGASAPMALRPRNCKV